MDKNSIVDKNANSVDKTVNARNANLQNAVKLATLQFLAGGAAGFVEVSIMHPLDLVKTRLQIQRGPDDPTRYKSIVDCFVTMYKTEGPLSFYKGILPPILADTPKRATKFFTFERFNAFYHSVLENRAPTPVIYSMAGLTSGLIEAIIINPFEVVKVQLQAGREQFSQQPSSVGVAREIIRDHGFGSRGLSKALTSTLGRHGVFNMIYFGFYHSVKEIVPSYQDKTHEFLRRLFIGFLSGSLASIVNIPFDVAKSRIQGPQPVPGQIKYRTCFATIRTVYHEEGYFALYKGLVPKVLRLGPGGAIMLVVYEAVFDWLKANF